VERDPLHKVGRTEGVAPSAPPDELPAALIGNALARLGGPAASGIPEVVDASESIQFSADVHEDTSLGYLSALQSSFLAPSPWSRPQVTRALALGGMLVGCAVGAYTLGGAGFVLALAAELMAFAGGMLTARSEHEPIKEENQRLRHQALHDSLTGLNNRGAIDDILKEQLQRAPFRGGSVSVIVADVDHFKKVNDTYGHPVGDEVLIEVARRVKAGVREQDSVGRYGGEELLVVLPGIGGTQAVLIAQRIRQAIAEIPFETQAGPLSVTMSQGVASTDYPHLVTPDRLIVAADEALYRAKHEGRNRVVVSV
jgi:diguanylate cyclase (GGDEF)-like protein